MSTSKPGVSPKPGTFKKGKDDRRNMAGNLNAALQSYEVRFRNALALGLPPEEFAQMVADDVRHRRPGAREFAGKALRVAQDRMELSTPINQPLEVIFHTTDE